MGKNKKEDLADKKISNLKKEIDKTQKEKKTGKFNPESNLRKKHHYGLLFLIIIIIVLIVFFFIGKRVLYFDIF